MADIESDISLEETNRRRIEMGLRPIPVPDDAHMKSKLSSKEDATGLSQDESSLSLEETNRLRISLGLRPIPVPGDEGMGTSSTSAPAPDSDELALANWRAKYEAEKKSAELETTRKRIQKAKERIERLKYLDGRSLGEQDEDNVDDVRKWVKRSKKKVKISIPDDNDEQEEMRQYTAEDLKGLKVGHSLEDIMDGEDVILTLKDRNVLDDGDDELVSLALEEHAKAAQNIENRKRKGRYTGFEDEDALGEKKGILSRYDEDDESNKEFFTLDSEVISVGDVGSEKQKKLDAMNPGKIKVSLEVDLPPMGIIQDSSDYMPAEQIKIKKPKKSKKSKNSRKRASEEDDADGRNQDAEMVDYQPDVIEDDDEDLQALLSKQRRSLQKKRKAQFLTPEMLAQVIRDQSTEDTPVPEGDESGLVIDDMTEFVGNVGNSIAAEEEEERERKERLANSRRSATTPVKSESEDAAMTNHHEEGQVKPETEDVDDEEVSTTGLEGEPVLSSIGMGATLSMLRSRGLIKTPDEQDVERQRIQRENMKWRVSMAQHKARSELELRAQREADRKSGKYDKLTQKEREEAAQRENQMRQLGEAREAQKRFKDYKPEIKIEYKDEFGRVMGQKEAFKHLSHQFHGKGSGKGKTEKRLKKIEDERKKESSSLFS
ncbi:SART-1 protein [Lipomyces doorenjongii]